MTNDNDNHHQYNSRDLDTAIENLDTAGEEMSYKELLLHVKLDSQHTLACIKGIIDSRDLSQNPGFKRKFDRLLENLEVSQG